MLDLFFLKSLNILLIVHSLTLNTNVPIHHRGNATLIVCFLIDMMSSSSLENKVSYSIIFLDEPYIMSLHVCLGVLVMFIMPLKVLTSFLQKLLSVSS